MPRWAILAVAGLVVIAAAVALAHRPSQAERAADLRGVLTEMTTDIQSCAAGVGESLTALRMVQAEHGRNSTDVAEGMSVAQQAAQACAPANNELIANLDSYHVHESLASFLISGAAYHLPTYPPP